MSFLGCQAGGRSGSIHRVPAEALSWRFWSVAERLGATAAVVALSPVLVGIGVAVTLLSGQSPLIAHLRTGRRGRPLWMLKYRTMWPDSRPAGLRKLAMVERVVSRGLPEIKHTDDTRVTSVFARWLRRYSLDELPQLLHILSGEMSFVGPRPLIQAELDAYYGRDAEEVLALRPGLTGLWQVSGRSRLSYEERRRLDLQLVRRRSARMYGTILLRTVPVVAAGRTAW